MSDDLAYRVAELERRLNNVLRLGVVAEADYAAARVRVQSGDILTERLPWFTRRASNDADWWAPEVGEQVMILSPCGDAAQGVALPAVYQTAYPAPADRETIHRVAYADGAVTEYDRAAHILHAYVPGDIRAEVDQDAIISIGRNVQLTVGQDVAATVGGSFTGQIGGDASLTVSGNASLGVGGDVSATAQGKADISAQGDLTVSSASTLTLAAPSIVINGPLTQGGGSMGSGAEIIGPVTHRDGDYTQTNGDVVSDGVSLQHHVHPENDNGGPTGEPQ